MGFYKEIIVGCIAPATKSFSLYNAAAFRPSSGDNVWSSSACSAAEKHISGVYVDYPLKQML